MSDDFEVIVIDNASSDGSPDAIKAEFPQVQFIQSDENLGFAKANNVAAKESKAEHILLLNPDTLILDHAIDRLMSFAAENPNAGIWGGRTKFPDGSLNPTSSWRFMSLWSILVQAMGLHTVLRNSELFNFERYGGWQRDTVREVDIVSGCFLLIRRDLWEKLGGFDDSFFMYAEEADLCYRTRQLGMRPLFTPEATIVHYGGASETVLSDKIIRLLSGKISFINKHWSEPKRTLGISLFKLRASMRALGHSVRALLTRSERHEAAALQWRSIWLARHKWAAGYKPVSK